MKKIITSALFVFGLPILFLAFNLEAAENTKAKAQKVTPTATKSVSLKENQYSLDKDNKITVYTVKDYDGLTLTSNCFKKNKPNCQAYTSGLKKVDTQNTKPVTQYNNNMGSIHCSLIGGKGVIVKSHTGGESDFCLFKDGSMVSSWSAYYKIFPQKN